VQGYTLELWAVRGAQPFTMQDAQIIAQMLAYAGQTGGSNPGFDVKFLKAEFARVGMPWPKISHRMIDVASMAVHLEVFGLIPERGMKGLRNFFGISEEKAHTARADCDDSIKVFEALLTRALK
jgi:hypothetical protein